MKIPNYIGLEDARNALAEIGVNLTQRQIKRAAEPDASGKRKLPFFVDPIEGTLKIEKGVLIEIYTRCQVNAENNAHINTANIREVFDLRR